MTGISILIPTYNYGSFLKATLDCLAPQLHQADEVIIQDNVSTDDTPEIVERFGSVVSSRLIYSREQDSGQSDALSRGLDRATNPWIVWLNADDRLDRLDLLRDMASDNVDVAAAGYVVEDQHGHVLREFPGRPLDLPRLLVEGCYLFSGAILFRTTALKEIGGFDPRWQYCMDYDLLLRLASDGVRAVSRREPAATFRLHPTSKTTKAQRSFVRETHYLRMRTGHGVLPAHRLYLASATHAAAALSAGVRYTRSYSAVRNRRRRLHLQ